MARTLRCEHHGSKKTYKEERGESKTTGFNLLFLLKSRSNSCMSRVKIRKTMVDLMRQSVSARDLPHERDGLCEAVESRCLAALNHLEVHRLLNFAHAAMLPRCC